MASSLGHPVHKKFLHFKIGEVLIMNNNVSK